MQLTQADLIEDASEAEPPPVVRAKRDAVEMVTLEWVNNGTITVCTFADGSAVSITFDFEGSPSVRRVRPILAELPVGRRVLGWQLPGHIFSRGNVVAAPGVDLATLSEDLTDALDDYSLHDIVRLFGEFLGDGGAGQIYRYAGRMFALDFDGTSVLRHVDTIAAGVWANPRNRAELFFSEAAYEAAVQELASWGLSKWQRQAVGPFREVCIATYASQGWIPELVETLTDLAAWVEGHPFDENPTLPLVDYLTTRWTNQELAKALSLAGPALRPSLVRCVTRRPKSVVHQDAHRDTL